MESFITVIGCMKCGKCDSICEAIDRNDEVVRIDYNKCTACMRCVVMCPNKALRVLE